MTSRVEGRHHWLALATQLARSGLLRADDQRPSRLSKHGFEADQLEAIARPMLLASIIHRAGGEAGPELLDGYAVRIEQQIAKKGLLDPQQNSHAAVESASLGLSLLIAGPELWARFSKVHKDQLMQWIRECGAVALNRSNNWQLFAAVAHGVEYTFGEADNFVSSIRIIESLNLGRTRDGWFSDGPGRTYDYYNSFAFHFYPGILGFLLESVELLESARQNLEVFLPQLDRLIDVDGRPIYFGRSLTYKAAIVAPFSVAGLLNLHDSRFWRYRLEQVASFFFERPTTQSLPNVDLGWIRPELHTVQPYSGWNASFWFSKAFVNLCLPADSSYWSGRTSNFEERLGSSHNVLDGPGFVILDSTIGENTHLKKLVNHGSYDRTTSDLRKVSEPGLYSSIEFTNLTAPVLSEVPASASVSVQIGKRHYVRHRPINYCPDVSSDVQAVCSEWSTIRASNHSSARPTKISRVLQAIQRRITSQKLVECLNPRISFRTTIDTARINHEVSLMQSVLPLRRRVLKLSGHAITIDAGQITPKSVGKTRHPRRDSKAEVAGSKFRSSVRSSIQGAAGVTFASNACSDTVAYPWIELTIPRKKTGPFVVSFSFDLEE